MYDVIVIGGGVIGAFVLRSLSGYDLKICLLEKENDVCMGQSKANSGIVHAGFDAACGTLKAKFNVIGNKMMKKTAEELGVKFIENGSLVVAFDDDDIKTLGELLERGKLNGVEDISLISKEELKKIEPNVSDRAKGALYAKTGAIVCPYELTIAAIGNAMDNGAELKTDFNVTKIVGKFDHFKVFSESGNMVEGKIVVNCAGLGGQKVSELAGEYGVKLGARKGEYILLDRESGDLVSHTLFFTPTEKGKGILVSQTADKNIILGPTAEEVASGDTDTTSEGLASVVAKAKEMCDNIPFYNTITSFAGVRAYSESHDFVIGESLSVPGFVNCVGIESPGLTSAPAIGEYVVSEIIAKRIPLTSKPDFNPNRKPDHFFKNLTSEEKNRLIAQDGAYGHVVCRCEGITEGEIRRAVRENPPAKNVDAVKRRTRAGMGRCQGGFCQPYVAEIIAEELGTDILSVTKSGKGSELLAEKIK